MFSGVNQALLTLGSKTILSISAHSVSFDLSFMNSWPPKRAQICWDGSKASLFVNCTLVQSKEFVVTDQRLCHESASMDNHSPSAMYFL